MVKGLRAIKVRTAAADAVPKVAAVLADAFINDPVYTWLLPASLRLQARLRTMSAAELEGRDRPCYTFTSGLQLGRLLSGQLRRGSEGSDMARVRWWLVFVFGGVVLGVVGLTLLSGTAQFLAFCLGVAFVVLALYRRAGGTDYQRERPVPPGS